VAEESCEAAPGSRVTFAAATDEPLTLSRVELTSTGLETSFSLGRHWSLNTGTCEISSPDLEFKGFVMALLAELVALGVCSSFGKWLCK